MLCTTVVCNDTHIDVHEQFLKISVGLGLVLVCVHLFRCSILCVFWFSVDSFVLVLFVFVVFLQCCDMRLAGKNVS